MCTCLCAWGVEEHVCAVEVCGAGRGSAESGGGYLDGNVGAISHDQIFYSPTLCEALA